MNIAPGRMKEPLTNLILPSSPTHLSHGQAVEPPHIVINVSSKLKCSLTEYFDSTFSIFHLAQT